MCVGNDSKGSYVSTMNYNEDFIRSFDEIATSNSRNLIIVFEWFFDKYFGKFRLKLWGLPKAVGIEENEGPVLIIRAWKCNSSQETSLLCDTAMTSSTTPGIALSASPIVVCRLASRRMRLLLPPFQPKERQIGERSLCSVVLDSRLLLLVRNSTRSRRNWVSEHDLHNTTVLFCGGIKSRQPVDSFIC